MLPDRRFSCLLVLKEASLGVCHCHDKLCGGVAGSMDNESGCHALLEVGYRAACIIKISTDKSVESRLPTIACTMNLSLYVQSYAYPPHTLGVHAEKTRYYVIM